MKHAPIILHPGVKSVKWTYPPVTLHVVGEIDEDMAETFVLNLFRAIQAGQTLIPIYIDSEGGCVYSLLKMMGALKNVPDGVTISTIVEGKAMSAASALFTCGHSGFRYVSEWSTLMIHTVRIEAMGGTTLDVRVESKEMDALNDQMFACMDDNCGKERGFFTTMVKDNEMNNANWYVKAEHAVSMGIADHVGYPTFGAHLSIDYKFEHTPSNNRAGGVVTNKRKRRKK